MKTLALTAATLLVATAANAETLQPSKYQQTADTMSTSSSPMQDTTSGNTVKEPANIRGGSSMSTDTDTSTIQPQAGDDMSADTATMGSTVKVKLADGKIITVADSAASPWSRSPDLKGYDRFTFDPVNNIYVAGKGEKEFDGNWDDNGNRIRKVVKVSPKKVQVESTEEATTETTTQTTTTEEEPASEPAEGESTPAAQ